MKRIAIAAAQHIADKYRFDQVVIYARKVRNDPDPHREHITAYGIDKERCSVAAIISRRLQQLMRSKPKTEDVA